MPISTRQIHAVEECVHELMRGGEPLLPGLRSRFPGLAFVRCDAEDMDDAPYRSGNGYQLFLIDCREGCIRLTCEPEVADGFVVTTP